MFTDKDKYFMQQAIDLAKKAGENQEVPVGAVLVLNDNIIGRGSNCPITNCDPTAHAEIMALREGGRFLQNYRLLDTTLYVTLEPCIMCVGALVHARVKRVVIGALDPKTGAVQSAFSMANAAPLNHKIQYDFGLFGESCSVLLTDFFQARR